MASPFKASCVSRRQTLYSPQWMLKRRSRSLPWPSFQLPCYFPPRRCQKEPSNFRARLTSPPGCDGVASGILGVCRERCLSPRPIFPKVPRVLLRDLRNQSVLLVETGRCFFLLRCNLKILVADHLFKILKRSVCDKFLGHIAPAFLCRPCCRLLLLPLCSCCCTLPLPF